MSGGQRFLIATGTSEYRHLSGQNREELVNEVARMHRLFTRFGYQTVPGFMMNMSGEELKTAIRKFVRQDRRAEDIIVFYYTGHGEVVGREFLLLPHDVNPQDVHEHGISASDLASWLLAGTVVGNVLIVLDTCHAGRGAEQFAVRALELLGDQPALAPRVGVVLVAAARSKERAASAAFAQAFEHAVTEAERDNLSRDYLDIVEVLSRIAESGVLPEWQHGGYHVIGGERTAKFLPVTAQPGPERERLRRLEEDVSEIKAALGSATRTLLPAERDDLRRILVGLPRLDERQFRSVYLRAVERAVGVRPVVVKELLDYDHLFDELDDHFLGRPGDLHPVVASCELLAGLFPGSGRLIEWANRVARRLGSVGITLAAEERLQTSAIVRLAPGRQRDQYLLTVWCYYGAGTADMEYQSPHAMPISEVREKLRITLSDALDKLALHQPGTTLVEFILPTELFDEAVEEWLIGEGEEPSEQIGWGYPTVLRDLHRIRHPRLHDRWRRNWAGIHEHSSRHGQVPLTWFDCHHRPDTDELRRRFYEGDAQVVAFTRTPLTDPGREALNIGLRSGISVMLWRRHDCVRLSETCDCSRFREAVSGKISSTTLADMPQVVHDLRMNGLVLLWDDPFRWPEPPARFAEPFWQGAQQ